MAKREIVWTETAAKQRRIILEYWNENNTSIDYSEKLIVEIRRRLDTLVQFPESGRKQISPILLLHLLATTVYFINCKK